MKKSVEISQIRFKYKENPLTIKRSQRNPFLQLNKWMNEAIKNKVFEPTAMALATINNKNQQVSNRIVLLKDVEKNCLLLLVMSCISRRLLKHCSLCLDTNYPNLLYFIYCPFISLYYARTAAFIVHIEPVSYTHLTLPTNREV